MGNQILGEAGPRQEAGGRSDPVLAEESWELMAGAAPWPAVRTDTLGMQYQNHQSF